MAGAFWLHGLDDGAATVAPRDRPTAGRSGTTSCGQRGSTAIRAQNLFKRVSGSHDHDTEILQNGFAVCSNAVSRPGSVHDIHGASADRRAVTEYSAFDIEADETHRDTTEKRRGQVDFDLRPGNAHIEHHAEVSDRYSGQFGVFNEKNNLTDFVGVDPAGGDVPGTGHGHADNASRTHVVLTHAARDNAMRAAESGPTLACVAFSAFQSMSPRCQCPSES